MLLANVHVQGSGKVHFERNWFEVTAFGGGVNIKMIYAEVRYHYIWGPTVENDPDVPVVNPPQTDPDRKANGKFLQVTFGVRF